MTYQLVLYGGMIVDGSGSPARKGTVACRDGKIVLFPADSRPAGDKTIDVTGLWVCPGFIDPHSHGDMIVGNDFAREAKTTQGITTEVAGMCGATFFPFLPGPKGNEMVSTTDPENLRAYYDAVLKEGMSRVDPRANHMHTDITMLVLADRIQPEAAAALKKLKYPLHICLVRRLYII